MTIYYHVDLESGITPDEKPQRHYSGNEELGRTIFKGLRDAKRKFDKITLDEIARLRDMRRSIRACSTRKQLIEFTEKKEQ